MSCLNQAVCRCDRLGNRKYIGYAAFRANEKNAFARLRHMLVGTSTHQLRNMSQLRLTRVKDSWARVHFQLEMEARDFQTSELSSVNYILNGYCHQTFRSMK